MFGMSLTIIHNAMQNILNCEIKTIEVQTAKNEVAKLDFVINIQNSIKIQISIISAKL